LGRPENTEDKDVLVLSRKVGERILIGGDIAITIVKVAQGGVRIGIDAPSELAVVREELAEQLQQADQATGLEVVDVEPPLNIPEALNLPEAE
jgi:carbon storage regulator